jgi:thymidylate kinase
MLNGSQAPVKILFAGIDGSGKTACLDLLLSSLERCYRVLKIGPSFPELYFRGNNKKLSKNFLYASTENRPLLRKHYARGLLVIARFLSNLVITQYASLRHKADIVMCETDMLLHPCVYVTYYHPWTKRVKNSVRFAVANRLFGLGKNSVIFYLDTDPGIAMKRVQKRNTTFDRHENIRDLQALKKELDEMVNIALDNGVKVYKINTDNKSLENVCQEVEQVLKSRFSLGALPHVYRPRGDVRV